VPDYDAGFKIVAHHAGRQLVRLAGLECTTWSPITGELQATERLADRAFRASRNQEHFVVYMEAYTRWVKTAPWSVLSKSGLLSERERLPTISLIYILQRRGYHPQGGSFSLQVAGQPTQKVWFQEICLWEQKPQPWWEDYPGLMALSPLCQQADPLTGMQHATRVIKTKTHDKIIRADLLTTLAIFGKLAHPGFNMIEIIGREAMKESKFYQEILEEGRQEGQNRARRADILETLQIRFGPEAVSEFSEALGLLQDPGQLTRLFRQAVQSRTLNSFRKALSAEIKNS
jgi:hypothetical protein